MILSGNMESGAETPDVWRRIRERAELVQAATFRIAEAVGVTESLQELFSRIHSIVGGLMEAGNLYIALLGPTGDVLSFPYFVDEVDEPIRLALSLHAPDDELRSRIMPVNERYPVAEIVAECRRQAETTRRRVFIEYVMLAEVNDEPEQAQALAALLGGDHFKVNLIPYNPTGFYEGSSRERIAAFRHELERARVPVTVRLTRGRDIEAACGQLAAATPVRRRSAPVSQPAPAGSRPAGAPRSRT